MTGVESNPPAVVEVGVTTLREAAELLAAAVHELERQADAERVRLDLEHLARVAEESAWPL